MKTKTMEAVNNLEKAFRQKYHWDENGYGEDNNRNINSDFKMRGTR